MKTRILTLAFTCCMLFTKAQTNKLPELELVPFAHGFEFPIDLANCGDDRLFVVERLGKIWAIDEDGKKMTGYPFLDITKKVFTVFPGGYDERGLLGLAFHPNYPDSPYLYVNYTGLDSNSHISRFTVDPNNANRALKNSELEMLIVNQPKGPNFVNHKAGCLKFGPDGYLYGTLGDGGFAGDPKNNAQDLSKLLGKMFRIDVNMPDNTKKKNYSVPWNNPYKGKSNISDEIWASGLRNPFRFSFDKLTGDLWLPDVGQDKWEEINMERKGSKGGRNYGWSCYEGSNNFKFNGCAYNGEPYTFPIVQYKHSSNNCAAITGGFVYRGNKYPNMYGKYIYNDYCTGKYSVVFKENQAWQNIFVLDEEDGEYVSFGEDSYGELYAIDEVTGEIERVIDEAEINGFARKKNNIAGIVLTLSPNPNKGQFTVELTATKKAVFTISVTDLAGATVFTETRQANVGKNAWNITSAKLHDGAYMLHVQSAEGSASRNFIIDK